MNFHTQYQRDPTAEQAEDLVEYLAKDVGRGGFVVDRAGRVEKDRVEAFAMAATRKEMVRQHSAAFANEHDLDALAAAGREISREHLEGNWLVGIHTSNTGNPHIHIAQAGSEDELWMDTDDIRQIRSDLATRLGESYGNGV
jgi:hypothetical protein